MLNKKNQTMSVHEIKRKELAEQVMHIWRDLMLAIEDTYAGEQMIAMIPHGWMREMAEEDQNNARLDLYNIIVKYDEARLNLRNYCIDHGLPQGEWKDGLTMIREHLRQAIFNK